MAVTPLKNTVLIPSKAPNLPIAPTQYSQQYQDQLNNIHRLYFSQVDNFTQAINIPSSGTTSDRPTTNLQVGQLYFDTTLNTLIAWTGSTWVTGGSAGTGTVTNVSALTLGTSGTDLTSTVVNSTTTPVITLNVPTASASNRGVLSSADWTAFNNKGNGTVTNVIGTAPVVSSGGTTPAISMAAATTSVSGYLTSTDWNTFNGKYSTGGALGTPSSGTVTNLTGTASININGTVGATTPSTGVFTTLTDSGLTSGRVTYAGTGGLLQDSANLNFNGTQLGIGIAAASYPLTTYSTTDGRMLINGDGVIAGYAAARYSTDAAGSTNALRKYRGSYASPLAVASGDQIGTVNYQGYGGTTLRGLATINAYIDTYVSDTSIGSYLNFATTANGSITPVEQLRIDNAGNVLVTGAGSLGYGTGSGGTITQLTSRTTGVTLSKSTGAITMFSAAGSTTAASFTVTNTLVAATDTILLNQKSGTNLYNFIVTAVAAGSFKITFYTTGGTATDAPVINFNLIKGVTA
jgi:hypothetical protein